MIHQMRRSLAIFKPQEMHDVQSNTSGGTLLGWQLVCPQFPHEALACQRTDHGKMAAPWESQTIMVHKDDCVS